MSRFFRNTDGATAIEFALVAPIIFAFIFGIFCLGLALWQKNILQETAAEVARCLAVGSTSCGYVTTCNSSSNIGVCYATKIAAKRGLANVTDKQVTINAAIMINSVSYATVQIDYAFSMFGYNATLTGYSRFPTQ